MTKVILALMARIFDLLFFDSVLLSSHKYICYLIASFFRFLEELLFVSVLHFFSTTK